MGADDGELYILRPDEDVDPEGEESWVSPQPASEVILQTVAEEVDEDGDDYEPLGTYVDLDDLAALFDSTDGAATLSFEVEGHDVTVHRSGDIEVATAD